MRQAPVLLAVLCCAAVARGQAPAVAVAEGAQTDPAEISRLAESVLLGGIEAAQGLNQKQRDDLRAGLQRAVAIYKNPKYMDDIYASLTAEVERGVKAGRFTPKTGEELRTKAMGENDAVRRRNIAQIEEVLAYLQGADSGAAPFVGPFRARLMSDAGGKLAKVHGPAIRKDGAAAARKLTVQERQQLRVYTEDMLKILRALQEAHLASPPSGPDPMPTLPAEIAEQQRILDALREADGR